MVFLERSKSSPVTVDFTESKNLSEVVRRTLKKITSKVAKLRVSHDFFLDELLAQPMPELEELEIIDSDELPREKPAHLPSLTSLTIYGFDTLWFHTPILTSLHLIRDPARGSREWTTAILLAFLQSCPLLEVVFLSCDDPDTSPDSDDVVSLPLLCSFTHESPRDRYPLYLLDRLSLPPTCRVVLTIDVPERNPDPWIPGLPTPRNLFYLSDIRTVKIAARFTMDYGTPSVAFKIELTNSTHGTISFDRTSSYSNDPSDFSDKGLLEILESIEIDSVETLCFDKYPLPRHDQPWVATTLITQVLRKSKNFKTLILADDTTKSLNLLPRCPNVDTHFVYYWPRTRSSYNDRVVNLLQESAELWKKAGFPLKTLTLVPQLVEPRPSELERLRDCVGWVKVARGYNALNWHTDKYLLAITNEDNANRS